MDNGQQIMDDGQWMMDDGQWTIIIGKPQTQTGEAGIYAEGLAVEEGGTKARRGGVWLVGHSYPMIHPTPPVV